LPVSPELERWHWARRLPAHFIAKAFNPFNRVNVRAVNPNFTRAGEPLAAHDPRQLHAGIQLRF
jgi:acyl-homoserine lactone acylase PvdQ